MMSVNQLHRDQVSQRRLDSDDARSGMRSLHRATLSLYTDLSLDGVLRRITVAARELSNAKYAALGIPDERGGLDFFITDGMSEKEIQRIPHLPEGKGLIGEMIKEGKTICIPEISDHPKSAGFPPGHPEMHSFLGVPISAYGRPLGQIYLTDKQGAPCFTENDQRLIEMLAAHAAAAIENARLYRQVLRNEEELTQRNEELELIHDLTGALSGSIGLENLLGEMLESVIDLFDAISGDIFIADEGGDQFNLVVHRGQENLTIWEKQEFRFGEGFIGGVAKLGDVAWKNDMEDEAKYLQDAVLEKGYGTLIGVPLISRGQVVGVLSLAFLGIRIVSEREVGLLEAVGAGVGLGIENARLIRQARRLAILEERERIAMDLHDGIIQSIYAVGLTLDSIRLLIRENPDDAVTHLEKAIDGLNANIRDIRSYILDLQPSQFKGKGLAQGLSRLSQEFKANSRMDIDLHIEQDAVAHLEGNVCEALLLIAQEALANIAKHSKATKAWVSARSMDDRIYMQIIDNGEGFAVHEEKELIGHGLSNMAERARRIGGEFETVSNPGEGTTITVRLNTNSHSRNT
jgi:two-component system sensor histidine kinase DevS